MEIKFHPKAQKDILFWKASGNKTIQKRIQALLDDIMEHPFTGIGKPEALKYELAGTWSRRINQEHRLIYEIEDNIVYIISLRGHYDL